MAPDNEVVILVWLFCGGWNPALIESAAAYYGIADLDFLIEMLLAVRDFCDEHQRAQMKAGN